MLPSPGAAQESHLTLEEVVVETLRSNPSIALSRREIQVGQGELQQARGVFATEFSLSALGGRTAEDPASGLRDVRTESYEVGLAKRLRNGVVITPGFGVMRTRAPMLPGEPAGQATTALSVSVPLLRDRGGAWVRAPERSAELDLAADGLDAAHTAARTVYAAAVAYWRYVAATQRLEALAAAEDRARRRMDETRVLVAAAEQPAADLNQVAAALGSRRSQRIMAEQGLISARHEVGLTMGLAPRDLANLPPPAAVFPDGGDLRADSAAVQRLVKHALAYRADVRSSDVRARSLDVLRSAAESNLRPQLDLSVSLGYTGAATGGGFQGIVSPFYVDVPGPNLSMRVKYSGPLRNPAAQGLLKQRRALLAQREIVREDLERRVASAVILAAEAVQRSASSFSEATATVDLYRTTLDNETKKFRLGMATLFDVLLAEDGLTNALLNSIDSGLAYALALSGLGYESGTLVEISGDEFHVDPAALVRPTLIADLPAKP